MRASHAARQERLANVSTKGSFSRHGVEMPIETMSPEHWAGGIERDVAFDEALAGAYGPVTGAYHEKYDRYGPGTVGTVVSHEAEISTLLLVPR